MGRGSASNSSCHRLHDEISHTARRGDRVREITDVEAFDNTAANNRRRSPSASSTAAANAAEATAVFERTGGTTRPRRTSCALNSRIVATSDASAAATSPSTSSPQAGIVVSC